jgi:hypothetical protein
MSSSSVVSRLRGKETLISQVAMHLMIHWNTPCERISAAESGKRLWIPLLNAHSVAMISSITPSLECSYPPTVSAKPVRMSVPTSWA